MNEVHMYMLHVTYADPDREPETKDFPHEGAMRSWLADQGDTLTTESPGEFESPQVWRYGVSRGGFPVLTAEATQGS